MKNLFNPEADEEVVDTPFSERSGAITSTDTTWDPTVKEGEPTPEDTKSLFAESTADFSISNAMTPTDPAREAEMAKAKATDSEGNDMGQVLAEAGALAEAKKSADAYKGSDVVLPPRVEPRNGFGQEENDPFYRAEETSKKFADTTNRLQLIKDHYQPFRDEINEFKAEAARIGNPEERARVMTTIRLHEAGLQERIATEQNNIGGEAYEKMSLRDQERMNTLLDKGVGAMDALKYAEEDSVIDSALSAAAAMGVDMKKTMIDKKLIRETPHGTLGFVVDKDAFLKTMTTSTAGIPGFGNRSGGGDKDAFTALDDKVKDLKKAEEGYRERGEVALADITKQRAEAAQKHAKDLIGLPDSANLMASFKQMADGGITDKKAFEKTGVAEHMFLLGSGGFKAPKGTALSEEHLAIDTGDGVATIPFTAKDIPKVYLTKAGTLTTAKVGEEISPVRALSMIAHRGDTNHKGSMLNRIFVEPSGSETEDIQEWTRRANGYIQNSINLSKEKLKQANRSLFD